MSKIRPKRHLVPRSLGYTVDADRPKAGEFPKYCGLQAGALSVSIPTNIQSPAKQNTGVECSQLGLLSLFLSFLELGKARLKLGRPRT
jgi:hypothetical protein